MYEQVRDVILAHDDLGHVFEASLMLAVLAPFLVFAWFRVTRLVFFVYPLVVAAWYHGREKAQFEIHLKDELGLHSVIPLWSNGWWPGDWSRDGLQDFAVPTVYALACAIVLSLVFARMFPPRSSRP